MAGGGGGIALQNKNKPAALYPHKPCVTDLARTWSSCTSATGRGSFCVSRIDTQEATLWGAQLCTEYIQYDVERGWIDIELLLYTVRNVTAGLLHTLEYQCVCTANCQRGIIPKQTTTYNSLHPQQTTLHRGMAWTPPLWRGHLHKHAG